MSKSEAKLIEDRIHAIRQVRERVLTGRLNVQEAAIVHVLQELMQFLNPPPRPAPPPRPRVGFQQSSAVSAAKQS